jgi:hypothetical protein
MAVWNGGDEHVYFKEVVSNWGILRPDLWYQVANSIFSCAIFCANLKCSTFYHFICQLSKKKGLCMEKQEVFGNPGSRMFQRKVSTMGINHFTPAHWIYCMLCTVYSCFAYFLLRLFLFRLLVCVGRSNQKLANFKSPPRDFAIVNH